MESKVLTDELKPGNAVKGLMVVKIKRELRPYQNGYMFRLILTNQTGQSFEYVYWGGESEEEVRRIYDSIKADDVVLLSGKVNERKGQLQISTNPPDTISPLKQGEYNPADFVPPPRRNIEEMVAELRKYMEGVQNPEMKKVLEYFFGNETFLDRFKKHPGAIEIHHNWTGGLLQHTLEVIRFCETGKELFSGLDSDLMLTGAMLHDIGKLKELEVTTRIKGTKKGNLKGHIPMGFAMVSKAMDELGTSENVRDRLLHIILSHHGRSDFGSPKEPMLPEAMIVYYADELSSKLTDIIEFIKSAREVTEDDFMYNRRHGRNFLLR